MRCLILFSFLLILMNWKVSGESAEHENFQSVLEEFKNRMFEEIGVRIREEIARALTAFSEKLEHSYEMTKSTTVLLNDTSELEARVEILELEMLNVQNELTDIEGDVNNVEIQVNNVETQVNNVESQLINVQEDVTDNEDQIFGLVLNVEDLNEVTFVHQEQIFALQSDVSDLQNTDEQLDARITKLENNGSGSSNTTDLEIRVSTLEEIVTDQSASIQSLQETDVEIEQRVEDLEDYIIGNWTACESSPCINGATCVDVNVDTFICLCGDGYFGLTCSESYEDTYFLATISENQISPVPDPIVFDEARINPGGHYDPTTGIYTAPQDGTYEFYVHILSGADTGDRYAFSLIVDDVDIDYTLFINDADPPDYVSTDSSEMLELLSGQQVSVSPISMAEILGTTSNDEMYSWFSGRLIKAA